MANSFTPDELKALSDAEKPPEGYEKIPDEHRSRYIVLAIDQIGSVLVTMTMLFFQMDRRPEGFKADNAKIEGCVAGLTRAIWYMRGYRGTGHIIANTLNKKVDAITQS
jgi:hypothetical protein